MSVSRKSSFADGACGDQSPILRNPKRIQSFPSPNTVKVRDNSRRDSTCKRTAAEAGVGEVERVTKMSRSNAIEMVPEKDSAETNPKSLTVEVKERKCVREKQRRAELNEAYDSLAKTLSLPPKCKKTALLQKAEETIKALRKHIVTLQQAKSRDAGAAVGAKSLTVPVPWVLGTLVDDSDTKEVKAASPEGTKQASGMNDESIESTLVAQMKVCIDRMIKLTEMKQGKKLKDIGMTHSPLA